jgi:hypothetical protein
MSKLKLLPLFEAFEASAATAEAPAVSSPVKRMPGRPRKIGAPAAAPAAAAPAQSTPAAVPAAAPAAATAATAEKKFRALPPTYSHSEMTFEQVDRTDKAAIYKASGESAVWEVFKIKVLPPKTIRPNGVEKQIPEREKVPGDEDFGLWAWSYINEELAMKRYESIK